MFEWQKKTITESEKEIKGGVQRKGAKKGASVFFCIKCNVGLHPECFEKFRFFSAYKFLYFRDTFTALRTISKA